MLLLRMKNRANTGMYTQNWPKRARVKVLKKGQMKRRSSINAPSHIHSSPYIYASMHNTRTALRPSSPQPILSGA